MPIAHLRAWAPIFGVGLIATTLLAAQANAGDGRSPFGDGAAMQ